MQISRTSELYFEVVLEVTTRTLICRKKEVIDLRSGRLFQFLSRKLLIYRFRTFFRRTLNNLEIIEEWFCPEISLTCYIGIIDKLCSVSPICKIKYTK